jgi:hypothetical protein
MLHLPKPILWRIIRQLNGADRKTLACTNRALQAMIESRLWQSINLLQFGRTTRDNPSPAMPLGEVLDSILRGLQRRPERLARVKDLFVAVGRDDLKPLAQLLEVVGAGLEDLMIDYTGRRNARHLTPGEMDALQIHSDSISPNVVYSSLESLDIALHSTTWAFIEPIINNAPQLQRLAIRPCFNKGENPADPAAIPFLPHLRYLAAYGVTPLSAALLARLIEIHPLLEQFQITEHLPKDDRSRAWLTPVVSALRVHPTLHNLKFNNPSCLELEKGGFHELTELTIEDEGRKCYARSIGVSHGPVFAHTDC